MTSVRKGKCEGCPFNEGMTEEAERIQNYGCLPSAYDILKARKDKNKIWLCHSNEALICAGLAEQEKIFSGELISPTRWYLGEQVL